MIDDTPAQHETTCAFLHFELHRSHLLSSRHYLETMNYDTNNPNFASGPIDQFQIDDDSSSFEPVGYPNNASNNGAAALAPNNNAPTTWYQKIVSCFQISTMQQYFNVDTVDVKNRIIGSILHANKADYFRDQILSDGEHRKPDLYGPVWVTMTLVFFLAVTSNTSKYLHTDSMEEFEYDRGHLTRAFSVLTFYTFALPALLFVMMRFISVEISLGELVCIYGYSLVPFVPTTILCLVPSVFFEWMFLIFATVMSLMLVARNIAGPVMRKSAQWGGPIVMCIIGCHFVFYLVLKILFYRHRFHGDKKSGNDGGNDAIIEDDGIQGDDNMDNPTL